MRRSQRLLQGWNNMIYLRQYMYFGWPNQPSSGLDVKNEITILHSGSIKQDLCSRLCSLSSLLMTILACLLFPCFEVCVHCWCTLVITIHFICTDFFLIQEIQTLLFRKWFLYRKTKSSKEENKTWKVYTNGIWTLDLLRDDPACITLRYLCITFKSLKVALESVNLLFTYCRPKFIAHPIPQFWQIILPFLTAAQRKHVQIHVIKTCRQASVTNSLLTLNYPNTILTGKRFYALVRNLECTHITSTSLTSDAS